VITLEHKMSSSFFESLCNCQNGCGMCWNLRGASAPNVPCLGCTPVRSHPL